MNDDNRRFSRIPFKVKVELLIDDRKHQSPELSNLSVGGCLLPLALEVEPGTPCQITILLEGASDDTRVRIEGEVVRATSAGVALRFVRIDPDSLYHLHNIILYNAPDADAIEHEISRHPGLK